MIMPPLTANASGHHPSRGSHTVSSIGSAFLPPHASFIERSCPLRAGRKAPDRALREPPQAAHAVPRGERRATSTIILATSPNACRGFPKIVPTATSLGPFVLRAAAFSAHPPRPPSSSLSTIRKDAEPPYTLAGAPAIRRSGAAGVMDYDDYFEMPMRCSCRRVYTHSSAYSTQTGRVLLLSCCRPHGSTACLLHLRSRRESLLPAGGSIGDVRESAAVPFIAAAPHRGRRFVDTRSLVDCYARFGAVGCRVLPDAGLLAVRVGIASGAGTASAVRITTPPPPSPTFMSDRSWKYIHHVASAPSFSTRSDPARPTPCRTPGLNQFWPSARAAPAIAIPTSSCSAFRTSAGYCRQGGRERDQPRDYSYSPRRARIRAVREARQCNRYRLGLSIPNRSRKLRCSISA